MPLCARRLKMIVARVLHRVRQGPDLPARWQRPGVGRRRRGASIVVGACDHVITYGKVPPVMTRRGRRYGALIAAIVLLPTVACGFNDLGDEEPGEKEPPPPIKKIADAEALARQQFDSITQLTGGTWTSWTSGTRSCTLPDENSADDGRWELNALVFMEPPADNRSTALRAVQDKWQADGWKVTYETRSGEPDLTGVDPQTGFVTELLPRKPDPPAQIIMRFTAGCFRPAPGEHPATK
jgi:hypothetical protein